MQKLRILILAILVLLTSGCGYHFSKNTGVDPEEAGGFEGGPKSELEKVEDFIKGGTTDDIEKLAAIITSENVNTKTFTHEVYGAGVTALMLAVTQLGNSDPARFLLGLGADADVTDDSGKNSFDYLEREAQEIADAETPSVPLTDVPGFQAMWDLISVLSQDELDQKLIDLILVDDRDSIAMTIKEGADPNHHTAQGLTPLMVAVQETSVNSMRVLLMLVDQGIVDKEKTSLVGETVFEFAFRLWQEQTERVPKRKALNALKELNCHFDPNYKDPDRGRGCRRRR